VFDDFTGVMYDTSEGERIARTLGVRKAAILRNHGLLTVGETVDEAVWWFITMSELPGAASGGSGGEADRDRQRKCAGHARASWDACGRMVSVSTAVAAHYSRAAGLV
jgi:Class II Aldolase and Adducin N-terminal domain